MPFVAILTVAAALGCGLVAGIFIPFSTFIVRTLHELNAAEGIRAMQSINRTIVRGVFMPIFMTTALVCAAIIVFSLIEWTGTDAALRLAASALFIVGVVVVTGVANVPRNNMLDAADPHTAAGETTWAAFLSGWVPWNHVRTLASAAASALFTVSLVV